MRCNEELSKCARIAGDGLARRDGEILRRLAGRLAEIGHLPEMKEKAELWRKLNRLERTRPMVLLQNWTWQETGGTGDGIRYECAGEWARRQEREMRMAIWDFENIHDDMVFDTTAWSPLVLRQTGQWITADVTQPDAVGAVHYNPVLKGDEDPAAMLQLPTVTIDQEATELEAARFGRIWAGILPVRQRGRLFCDFAGMDVFIQWRGLDNALLDLVDRPDWVHAWLRRMADAGQSVLTQCEQLGALSLNNGAAGTCRVGPNGLGITDQLPAADFAGPNVRARDLWGVAATQIFADVSPAMHDEFALTHEAPLLSRFGFAAYGCCEPLHHKVDLLRRRIPNLRRISMSPWADVATGAAAVRNEIIFSYKPNPAILGMPTFELDEARRRLRDVFEITRGCVIEVLMKDLHHVNREPARMGQWVRMALELAEEYAA